jgi:hypothetical protein
LLDFIAASQFRRYGGYILKMLAYSVWQHHRDALKIRAGLADYTIHGGLQTRRRTNTWYVPTISIYQGLSSPTLKPIARDGSK